MGRGDNTLGRQAERQEHVGEEQGEAAAHGRRRQIGGSGWRRTVEKLLETWEEERLGK